MRRYFDDYKWYKEISTIELIARGISFLFAVGFFALILMALIGDKLQS